MLCSVLPSVAAKRVSVYVVAHPDDWQLFMGTQAYDDMQDTGNKVVIIYTTSGDATFKAANANLSFANAREKGVLNSIRFCSDVKSKVDSNCRTKVVVMRDHDVLHYSYKNVENYFLRLPDGCFSTGYRGQSLEYLYKGKINFISAIDESASYDSWQDLVDMMVYIIGRETNDSTAITMHIQEPEEKLSPGDHPDHRFSGIAALNAADSFSNVTVIAYVGYDVAKRPINLKPEEIALKAGIFAVADFGLTESRQGSTFDKGHINYLTRSYYRTILREPDHGKPTQPTTTEFLVAPNPSGDGARALFTLPAAEAVGISIVDETGRLVVMLENQSASPGSNEIPLPLSNLAAGNYIVTLQRASGKVSIHFTKK
jgi:LmbE family N-acetylglucosaminyl deacetylase